MKIMSKIPFTMIFLLLVANISLNTQNYAIGIISPPCFDDWEYTPIGDTCNAYGMQIEEFPASAYGLDPCENFCFLVTIDPGNSGLTSFALTASNGYYAELSTETTLQAVICIGQDSGIPIDLDANGQVQLDINVTPLGTRSGGCICSVMIGG